MPEATLVLIERIPKGEGAARDTLLRRYLSLLCRWAPGCLPARARDLLDTDDLVQVTLIRALPHVEDFDVRHCGSFLAYLRQILLNQVRGEIRRQQRRPAGAAKIEIEQFIAHADASGNNAINQVTAAPSFSPAWITAVASNQASGPQDGSQVSNCRRVSVSDDIFNNIYDAY